MPRAEDDAVAKATREDGSIDMDVFLTEYKQGLAERHRRLLGAARAS